MLFLAFISAPQITVIITVDSTQMYVITSTNTKLTIDLDYAEMMNATCRRKDQMTGWRWSVLSQLTVTDANSRERKRLLRWQKSTVTCFSGAKTSCVVKACHQLLSFSAKICKNLTYAAQKTASAYSYLKIKVLVCSVRYWLR